MSGVLAIRSMRIKINAEVVGAVTICTAPSAFP